MEELQAADNSLSVDMQLQLKTYINKMQQGCAVDQQGRVRALINAREALSALGTYSVETLIDNPTEGLVMPIEYVDSCPVIDGLPIWERLEGESMFAYEAFQKYLKMIQPDCPQRSVYRLALISKEEVSELNTFRVINHWAIRAQAYDDYITSNRAALRVIQQRDIEDRHAAAGKKLTDLAVKYLTTHEEMLTPKVAAQLLDLATKLERTTVGMSSGAEKGAEGRINVNVANTIGTPAAAVVENTVVTGNLDKDRERLLQVFNIMNSIGAIKPDDIVAESVVSE